MDLAWHMDEEGNTYATIANDPERILSDDQVADIFELQRIYDCPSDDLR